MSGPTLLEIKDLVVKYKTKIGTITAVDGINIELNDGEALGIIGESGSGKSTFGSSLMRILPRNASISGEIIFMGENLLELNRSELKTIRWEKVAMVFQNAQNSLDPTMRVGTQIISVIMAHKKLSINEARERVSELFRLVGLPPEYYNRYPHELSGGSRQRVIIAMALAMKPKLLIADEPTTGLDVSIQIQVLELLKHLQRELNMSMIFITHDITVAKYECDRLAVMYAGQIVEVARVHEIFSKPIHPYTIALSHNLLTLEPSGLKQPISGSPPDLLNPPKGCRFADRCELVAEICRNTEPPLLSLDGRASRCHFAADLMR